MTSQFLLFTSIATLGAEIATGFVPVSQAKASWTAGVRARHQYQRREDPLLGSSSSTTQLGLYVPFDEFGKAVELFYSTKPMESAFLTCSVKASAADAVAQLREASVNEEEGDGEDLKASDASSSFHPIQFNNKDQIKGDDVGSAISIGPIEIPRNLAFLFYGGIYCGLGQHFIYNELYPHWFGSGHDIETVLTKMTFDQLVHGPFLCLPLSYMFKALAYGDSVEASLEKYVSDIKERGLLTKYWMVWTPFEFVMFTWIPSWLVIPAVSVCSFFWLIVLSTLSNIEDDDAIATATVPTMSTPRSTSTASQPTSS